MNLSGFTSQLLELTSSLNPKIAIIVFLLCCIGEIGFGLPYVLEMMWLIAGYHLARNEISASELLFLWLIAQAGRQTGSSVLFFSSKLGMIPVKKFFQKHIEPRLPKKQFLPESWIKKMSNPSAFSIALARLVGLRVPAAVASGASNRFPSLVLGVILSSIIWDGIYIILGATVGTKAAQPEYMLLYSLGALTALYLTVLVLRYLIKLRSPRGKISAEAK